MPRSRIIYSAVSSVVIVLVPVVIILQWQNISDQIRLWKYQPSARIQAIAKDTTMNSYGQKLFYVNHPDLLSSKESFNQNCQSEKKEQSIVLGCFIRGRGIYIYDVNDPRLNGIHEVTSAHEMLHQAYERLSNSEKSRLNKLLEDFYQNITDVRIKKIIENYRAQDASIVLNEMHSVIGTEVRNLPPELEDYYKKYFTQRSKIIDLAEKYEAEFTGREAQVDAYDKQLEDLRIQIDSTRGLVEVQTAGIDDFRNQMKDLLINKNYEVYNARVPEFNSKVAQLNSKVGLVNGLIDQFNDILNKRNAIAVEQKDLVKAIDSRLDTVESQ